MTLKYFNVKNGLVTGNITLDASNSNVSGNYFIGNISVTNKANLGANANVTITGGSSGQLLATDGSGNLYWAAPAGGGGIGGSNTYVQFNDSGTYGGNANFTFDKSTGVVSASHFSGEAGNLSNIQAANISGAISYATTANSVAGSNVTGAVAYATTANSVAGANVTGQVANALVAGTIYTAAQPNITSVGTLTDLAVSGNVILGGNLTVNGTLTSINSTIIEIDDLAIVLANDASTSSQANGAGIIINGASANMLYVSTSNAFVFSHMISADGSLLNNLTGANVSGEVSFAATANAVAGANVSGQVGNSLVAGTVYTNSQPNITSVGTLTSLDVTGNISSGNANLGNLVVANFFSGNGHYLTDILGTQIAGEVAFANKANYVAGSNVNGQVLFAATANAVAGANVSGQVGNALIAGTVYTAAQPNITSVGTLISVQVSGTTDLGSVSNVTITGGTTGQYLQTDGAGNLSWSTVSASGGVSGTDTQLIFNDSGSYAGNASLVFDKSNTRLTVNNFTATSSANLGAVGNITITGGSSGQVLKTDGSGTLSWGTAAGSESTVTSVDSFTGDGTTVTFTLSVTPGNKNQTLVNYNGAMQLQSAYTLSGADITFSEAPANGSLIEIITQMGVTVGSGNLTVRNYEADGVQTTYAVSSGVNATNILVTENGLVQLPNVDYTVSAGVLTFTDAPGFSVKIQIRELGTAVSTITPVGADKQILFNDSGSFGNSAGFTFTKSSNTLSVGSIIPAADLTYNLGNSTRRWNDLYLSGNTIYLGNATITVDDTTGAVKMTPAATVANPTPVAQVVSSPRYVTMVTTGSLSVSTGTSRYYPPVDIEIRGVSASLSTTSSSTFTFKLKKNGTIVGTYSIDAGEYRLTTESANITVTKTDYLTVDITAVDGASELRIDLEYTMV